jgi:hypothetical protein
MKRKPSDYLSGKRYLKPIHLPDGGEKYEVTDIDEVDKSVVAGKNDWRIRLTLNDRYWFELAGPNLDAALDLLGDDFADWHGALLGFINSTFTARDGSEKVYVQIVSPTEIEPKQRPLPKKVKPETLNEIPFDR